MARDPEQMRMLRKWAFWRVNRDSFRRDQDEDDAGLDSGSMMSLMLVIVLLAIGIGIMFVLAGRA